MEAINHEENSLIAKVPLGAIFRHHKGKDAKTIQIGHYPEQFNKIYLITRSAHG